MCGAFGGGNGDRNGERERGPPADLGLHGELTTVCFDDAAGDGQAEAGATARPRPGTCTNGSKMLGR